MQIIVIEARTADARDIALPFDTDEHVVDAWDWIVGNGMLGDFNYRPVAEGDDPNRFFIEHYLADIAAGKPRRPLTAQLVRKLVSSIFGAELSHRIMDLYDPKPALKTARGN